MLSLRVAGDSSDVVEGPDNRVGAHAVSPVFDDFGQSAAFDK